MGRRLRIALAQLDFLVGDVEGNARKVIAAAGRARDDAGARLILFPELALTGYPPEDLLYRPSLLERVEKALHHITETVRGIDVLLGAPVAEGMVLYNAALYLRDGHVLAEYHKHVLPNYGVFDERRYFAPGTRPAVVELDGIRLGLTVCEDVWHPDPAKLAAEAGAELILNINASPFHCGKRDERLQALGDRIRDTGLPIVYVNLVGGQDELVFDGESMVLGADGEPRFRAPAFEEGVYTVDVPLDAHDRDAELAAVLAPEAAIYKALVLGVRDYVAKNGFNGVVLGLSGGIDSALTLAIAVDALGAEAVEAVMMPSRYTADMSVSDARAQAETLGVKYRNIPIEPAFTAFLGMLEAEFRGLPRDTTEENIQARCRGIVLMAISNKTGRMLLTTGNKSEMAVGYATLYGDMAGGFAPLKDVAKTLVYRLARYRNGLPGGPVIPERVIERPPSAELAPNQVDQDSLPPYDILDGILERFVERDWSLPQIVADGYDEPTVRRVMSMVLNNEYKRRQAPPGVRITQRAFGKDRRYPITSGYGRGI
jgi:NAD+ synthase (glutamine-hydrolysing)